MKVGVPVSDLLTGLYATLSILAALRHRDHSGEGQHIDCALLDTQVALLANQASNYLNGGMIPGRLGNEHPNTVPYQDFMCLDGSVLVALGNDRQFRDFCELLGLANLTSDPRFIDNASRSINRAVLQDELRPAIARWRSNELIAAMEAAKLPGGRVNEIPEMLADPHIAARELIRTMTRSDGTEVHLLAFPAKLSASPAGYRHAPPRSGEDSSAVLADRLGLDRTEIERLIKQGIIAT
jgi:crotonobetainyl-CoA:carnitine CoA-transferase CaiB-like acyl-CoA transferase